MLSCHNTHAPALVFARGVILVAEGSCGLGGARSKRAGDDDLHRHEHHGITCVEDGMDTSPAVLCLRLASPRQLEKGSKRHIVVAFHTSHMIPVESWC